MFNSPNAFLLLKKDSPFRRGQHSCHSKTTYRPLLLLPGPQFYPTPNLNAAIMITISLALIHLKVLHIRRLAIHALLNQHLSRFLRRQITTQ